MLAKVTTVRVTYSDVAQLQGKERHKEAKEETEAVKKEGEGEG